ncbi:hypothetical protein A7K91_22255 [Paenibacillus oryzae]|uniref:Peptidase S9 n=1 Tax=Paenibacillus oryzae TaxID=1844972 RepID=A0A1A5YPR8_9BACL|nr:PD40 domain-containing protein [Paenibacillus oryzae]OBR67607.1 hypothetical protein A7K91_22255 [Paenibacillus oryzae]
MSEVMWEQTMEQLKEQLPVNEELKRKLHASLLRKRRQGRIWRGALAGITAAALLLGSFVIKPWEREAHVLAASLHIASQFTLSQQLGKENSVAVAEFGDVRYYAVEEEGIYAQYNNGLELLVPGGAEAVAVSPDGGKLAYTRGGNVYVYDLKQNQNHLLLKSEGAGKYLSPVWSPSGERIAVVKLADDKREAGIGQGEEEKSDVLNQPETAGKSAVGDIMEVEVKDGKAHLFSVGSSPSYVSGQRTLVFEREGAIMSINLKTKEERKLAEGSYPSVSPDGNYVAFVVTRGNPAMEELWIADIDFQTRKRLIENQLADAWDRNTGEIIEGKQQARFTLEQPVWSGNSSSMLVYKTFHTNDEYKKLVRLEVTDQEPTPEDIVAGSIEALIYRDEEYAHSFFSYDPGYLKGTSPRQIGYSIIDSGEKEGVRYVDAETYLSYSDPYMAIQKTRYFLSEGEMGYRIDDMLDLSYTELSVWDDGIYRSIEGVREEEPLLKTSDLPQADGWSNAGVDSLNYRESDKTLWLTLKREKEGQSALSLISYDFTKQQWTEWSSYENARSHMLLVDDDGGHVSMDLTLYEKAHFNDGEEADSRTEVVVYDVLKRQDTLLSKGIEGIPPDDVNTRFWKNGVLVYYAEAGGRDVFLSYNACGCPKSP